MNDFLCSFDYFLPQSLPQQANFTGKIWQQFHTRCNKSLNLQLQGSNVAVLTTVLLQPHHIPVFNMINNSNISDANAGFYTFRSLNADCVSVFPLFARCSHQHSQPSITNHFLSGLFLSFSLPHRFTFEGDLLYERSVGVKLFTVCTHPVGRICCKGIKTDGTGHNV